MTEVLQKVCYKCRDSLKELKWNMEKKVGGTGSHVILNCSKLFVVSRCDSSMEGNAGFVLEII